jgi:hypothetical protein
MAHDLIFGKTSRDWSCGGAATPPATSPPWERLPEAPRLAEAVRSEMSRAASAAIRLRKRGLLPDAAWREFGKLHRRWITLSDARRGRWRESDSLLLWNLRKSCEGFGQKFSTLDDLSRPGSTALVPTTPTPPAPSSPAPWYVALGAALALAGVGLFTNSRERGRQAT